MKYASININFDSLSEAFGFPSDFRDPSYEKVADRFLALAEKYRFKYTIFIIGRDLEDPRRREAVKEWARLGHEIGNHSWSHHTNLGMLPKSEMKREIERSHEIIFKTTGKEPRGFIAPAWGASRSLLEVLIELNYLYDTSPHPSWLMYLALTKAALNHLNDGRFFRILQRRDLPYFFCGSRNPFQTTGSLFKKQRNANGVASKNSLTVLPLPVNRYRVSCWHTTGFMFGWKRHSKLLDACLRDVDAFYYVTHPADLMDLSDIESGRKSCLERIEISLEEKLFRMDECIRTISEQRKLVTMEVLAEKVRSNMGINGSAASVLG